ncbi:BIIDXI-like protein At5g11420 [Oryza sativa Japonica Group]|jgi:hypothetical protein|nr:uncharacterized protein LOC4328673 [Oryza sativa Japonica Group]XP_052141876.1 protein DUF642 L-GALACTONO-1,4-LACTONE-RESPONSIVE GENE 2-like [Oryza glaberrima]EEC72709.1 hypothetical protein OsI_06304 [Oryza sativa Indica Group]KAF2943672.1 hypothetical protein DAI22_02g082100 [Oryza sativa Japonica Group]
MAAGSASLLLLMVVLCAAASGTALAAITDGLLANGNFERGPAPSQLRGTRVVGASAIPSWRTSGFVEYIPSGRKQGDMVLVVPEGSHAVRLGNEASIRQRLAGAARGARYALTFSAARTCAQAERLNVSASGQWAVLPMQTMYSSNGWDSYAWAWDAAADAFDVVIHNPGVTEDPACGPLIDSVAIRTLNPPRRTNKNLVKNGDFEEGPYIIPGTRWGVLIPSMVVDEHSPLPGWMVESLKAVKYIDSDHFAVPRGRRAVELLAGRESAIAQVIRTVPGRQYALSFTVGDASNGCEGSLVVEAYAGRESTRVAHESAGRGGAAKRAVLPFRAAAARTRVVFFSSFYSTRSDDMSSLCGPVIDDVAVVSVRARRPAAKRG